jgi:DNA-binding IclR family transcriptional regulator
LSQHPAPLRSVVGRITAILSTFLTGDSHSVTEIARLTGLPVSTTHRLTSDLAAWQLLVRTADGRYRIGLTVQQLGGDTWSGPALAERAAHVVTDLCDATGRRARLGVLQEGRVGYIEKRAGGGPVTPLRAGATLPAHATAVGKALLAFAPRSTVATVAQRLAVYTPHTLDTPERLDRALGIVRLSHLAVSHDELVLGDTAVAAPVFGCGGQIVAALEIEVADLRAELGVARAALAVAARSLSRELAVGDAGAPPRPRLVAVSHAAGT